MARKTLTRADIAEQVYRRIGLSRSDSRKLVKQVIEEIIKSLVDGQSVKISSFGSFMVRHKRARIGRNPKTGVEATISERRVLNFRAGRVLKERVRLGSMEVGESRLGE